MPFEINLIFSCDTNGVISVNNTIPWDIQEHTQYFTTITTSSNIFPSNTTNTVVMGLNTYKFFNSKPLLNRNNILISKTYTSDILDNIYVIQNVDNLLDKLREIYDENIINMQVIRVFIIGGSELINYALNKLPIQNIYISLISINNNYINETNKVYVKINNIFKLLLTPNKYYITNCSNLIKCKEQKDVYVRHITISKKLNTYNLLYACYINYQEDKLLDIYKDVLNHGNKRQTRNSTVLSIFNKHISFDLTEGFPLLTTKRMFFKGIVEELLWMLRGETDSKILNDKGVKIWNGNSSREALDKLNLSHYKEGDCGPIYGYQWRNFSANYNKTNSNGVDQLRYVIDLIKNDPTSRRIIINAWNPILLDKMCLPPCHVMYQFYVNNNKLDCILTQRSADLFLGIPFNIASCALLTTIIAKTCNMTVGSIHINIGDAHIYTNQINAVNEQIKRNSFPFPTLSILKDITSVEDIEKLTFNDFKLQHYYCHPSIKVQMIS